MIPISSAKRCDTLLQYSDLVAKLTVSAAPDHLQRLTGKSPVVGLSELIWNALDADATYVNVAIERTSLGAVDHLIVADNGHGFGGDEVERLFKAVGGSWKKTAANGRTRSGSRELHGTKGEGRALAIGDRASWRSVTESSGDTGRQAVEVSIHASAPHEVDWNGPSSAATGTGTTVTVTAGTKEPNALLHTDLRSRLCATFALFLTEVSGRCHQRRRRRPRSGSLQIPAASPST